MAKDSCGCGSKYCKSGPDWVAPSVSFPGRHPETGDNLIEFNFCLPIRCIEDFFVLIADPMVQRSLNSQLTEIMAENFDAIAESH